MSEPRFKRGDRVRHRASGEVGIVIEVVNLSGLFDYNISTGFRTGYDCHEEILEPADEEPVRDAGPPPDDPDTERARDIPPPPACAVPSTIEATLDGETGTYRVIAARGDGLLGQGPRGVRLIRAGDARDPERFAALLTAARARPPA